MPVDGALIFPGCEPVSAGVAVVFELAGAAGADSVAGLATVPCEGATGCEELGAALFTPLLCIDGLDGAVVPVAAGGVALPAPTLLPIAAPLTTNSTRRFIWRPEAVAFEATGFDSPRPLVVTASGPTPWPTRKFLTVSARLSESVWLYCGVPVLSVKPSISSLRSG